MDILVAGGGLKIVANYEGATTAASQKFAVLFDNKKIDAFAAYDDASKLAQDLFANKAINDDPMLGKTMFCPSALGNGYNVVVVAKTKNGFLVQPCGTNSSRRFEVEASVLSEPLSYPW